MICMGLAATNCSGPSIESRWKVDSQFSGEITSGWQSFAAKVGTKKASETVDSIEVYKSSLRESDVITVEEIRSFAQVLTSQNRQDIETILDAAHTFT